jgi:hypothetical protein
VDVLPSVLDHATLPRAAAATATHHFLSRPVSWVEDLSAAELDELRDAQRRTDVTGLLNVCPECGEGWPDFIW